MTKFFLKNNIPFRNLNLLGYTRNNSSNPDFYVKKFSKKGKSLIFIDLKGMLVEKNQIVWNKKEFNENMKPIYPLIQDLIEYNYVDFVNSKGYITFAEFLEYSHYNYEVMRFFVGTEVEIDFFDFSNTEDYKVIELKRKKGKLLVFLEYIGI